MKDEVWRLDGRDISVDVALRGFRKCAGTVAGDESSDAGAIGKLDSEREVRANCVVTKWV
jgi:hypothetical protein